RDSFLAKYPFYNEATIRGEMYGLSGTIETLGTGNIMLVRADLDENLVYSMVKAVFDNLDDLYNAHPSARAIKLETAAKGPIPLHPGAERYFREVGVLD